jgi:type I restriction enzyme S subunit
MANFGVIAEAPIGIRQLRQLILTLALQGQLTTTEPGDLSVGNLLLSIAEERRLRQMAQPQLSPLDAADTPYSIPEHWRWIRLGHLLLGSGAGRSPQCESRPRKGDEWGVLKVSAVSWGQFNPDENKALPVDASTLAEHEVHDGDLLISRANTANLVARSVLVEAPPPRLLMSDKIVRLILSPSVDARYINSFNNSAWARKYYLHHASGTSSSMKNISRQVMLEVPIAVPPAAEQQRIVAKVDQLMAMLDDLEQRQEKKRSAAIHVSKVSLDSLVNAEDPEHLARAWERMSKNLGIVAGSVRGLEILRDAALSLLVCGSMSGLVPGQLAQTLSIAPPRGWPLMPVQSCLREPLVNGRSVTDQPGGFPVLRLSSIRGTSVDFRERKEGAWTRDEAERWIVVERDFLVARGNGSLDLVGRGAVAPATQGFEVAFPDTMIRIRVDHALLDPDYLAIIWNSRLVRHQLESRARTTSGIYKISQGDIQTLVIPVPLLEEQRKIIAQHAAVSRTLQVLAQRIASMHATAEKLALSAMTAGRVVRPHAG